MSIHFIIARSAAFSDNALLYSRFFTPPYEFCIPLGYIAAHGEREVLIFNLDALLPPFLHPFLIDYMMQRIDNVIPSQRKPSQIPSSVQSLLFKA
ncbi:MAG: hypothetical protein ACR5K7_02665 [Symbiopectobacterium sp.]